MQKLNDGVHNCSECKEFPCTSQPFVDASDFCEKCGKTLCKFMCCYQVIVPLLPCEIVSGQFKVEDGGIMLKSNGWCSMFDKVTQRCKAQEFKPIACRVASCTFIDNEHKLARLR